MSAKIYAALIEAQKKVKPIEKDGRNAYHNYDYVTAEAMIEDCRAALTACGITTMPRGWRFEAEPARIAVTFHLVHAEGDTLDMGEYSISVVPEKGRPIDKAESAARTYILSYFLRDLLLVPRIDKGTAVDARDDRSWQPGYPSPKGAENAAKAARTTEMAPAAKAIKDDIEKVADIKALADLYAKAKKELKGQHFEDCKAAYAKRYRELQPAKQNGAAA